VVVSCKDTFYYDLTSLTPVERQLHQATFPAATYHWPELRDETLDALRAHFGNGSVSLGKKSIKVVTSAGGRPADVVPAMQFRRYASFPNREHFTAHWGIQFFDTANNPIVNYPKYHIERGEAKNQQARTQGQYKATVRIFKNLRNYVVDRRLLGKDVAPS